MQRQEDSLLDQLRKGDRKALEQLYDTWSPVLFGVAMRYCSNREEAEDMLHEALMKIIRSIKEFRPAFPGAFEAWMKRITINQCLSALRKKIDFVNIDRLADYEQLNNEEEVADDDFPQLDENEVIRMMQKLPPGYRTILNMYVFERMSHKEIAAELKISQNTSKSQLSKARNAMKKQLLQQIKGKEVVR